MIFTLTILAFSFFIGLVMELYKKAVRKDKSGDTENKLVAFGLSIVFAFVEFKVINVNAVPNGLEFSPWIIALLAVFIYVMQKPACMDLWKPILKKWLEKKL